METQTSSPKPKFRWARLFLIIVLACLFMCIGYVGGNLLQQYLAKRLKAYEEKEREKAKEKAAAEIEDVEHEEVEEDNPDEDNTDWEELLVSMPDISDIQTDKEPEKPVTKVAKPKNNKAVIPLKKKS